MRACVRVRFNRFCVCTTSKPRWLIVVIFEHKMALCGHDGVGTASDSTPMYPAIINLNVGGTMYTTRLSTLTISPESETSSKMLCAMFSERQPRQQTIDGRYFIDRDGRNFHHVLNYLRHQQLPRKGDVFVAYEEACYYQVPGLIKWCQQQPLMKAKFLHQAFACSISDSDTAFFGQALIQCAIDAVEMDKSAARGQHMAERWFCERPKLIGDTSLACLRLKLGIIEVQSRPNAPRRGSFNLPTDVVEDHPTCHAAMMLKARKISRGSAISSQNILGDAERLRCHVFDCLPLRDSTVSFLLETRTSLSNDGLSTLDVLLARVNGELVHSGLYFLESEASRPLQSQNYVCAGCPTILRLSTLKLHVDLSRVR